MTEAQAEWTLGRVWRVLRKRWPVIIAVAVLFGAGTYAVEMRQKPMYRATAKLYFALSQSRSATDLAQGSTFTLGQMESFAQLATSALVLLPVLEETGSSATPKQLAQNVDVSIPKNTVFLSINVSSDKAEDAAQIANLIAESVVKVLPEVVPKTPDAGVPTISAKVTDQATRPNVPFSPNKSRDAALTFVLGVLLGTLAMLGLDRVSRARSPQAAADDVESDVPEPDVPESDEANEKVAKPGKPGGPRKPGGH